MFVCLFVVVILATEGRASVTNCESVVFHSDLSEGEGSDASTANCTNGGLPSALAIQPAFQKLSSSERDELMAKLYDDQEMMMLQFGYLVVDTCCSIQERISIGLFRLSILSLRAYDPAPGERDRSLLGKHSGKINAAKSIADIFAILAPYMNYLNYEILKYIINNHGTSDDHARLKNYHEKLTTFCERRIFEVPLLESGSDTSITWPNHVKFVVKLDISDGITVKESLRIRNEIANILHVNLAAFLICGVDRGCVELTILIPKFVAQEIFPLSCEQTSALLKDISVIRLECGDYVLEV